MGVKHTYLTANGLKTDENLTRAKAIRQKCLDCSCWQMKEIALCTVLNCALYPFRMGRVAKAVELEKKRPTRQKIKSRKERWQEKQTSLLDLPHIDGSDNESSQKG